jgi:peroxiredoxin
MTNDEAMAEVAAIGLVSSFVIRHSSFAMAVSSSMLALGTPAPEFSLPDVTTGGIVSLGDFATQGALLVIFLCVHCPYVVHVRPELARLATDYAGKGLAIVGITSNDVAQYPEDAPAPTAAMARAAGLRFPILYDESQAVARAFTAACTPDFFLFDAQRRLTYRGQLDSSRPGRGPDRPGGGALDGSDLRGAIDATLAGCAVSPDQRPSLGCGIKWKRGQGLG